MNIKNVGIVGAGTMGQGIAETIAGKGFEVFLLDKTETDLERTMLGLEKTLAKRLRKWGITESEKKVILSRIMLTTNWQLLQDCELVIEAIWENLDDKIDVVQQLDEVIGPDAVIASNTSTLSITEIAAHTAHPERLIGLHFHYPPDRRELVEVVRGLKTSDSTVRAGYQFIQALDKTAVQVFESPGFVTSRLMLPMINEAISLVAEGVATAKDVDIAMKAGYGFHLGPLELADQFGLDSVLHILEALFRDTADPKYRPATYLRKLVRGGRLGAKTGEGIFCYDEWGERVE